MKRIFLMALALVSGICSAQTFKVQNLDVLGTSTLTGLASFTVRPTFNGNTPWDTGNLTPANYATLAGTNAFTGSNSFSIRPTFNSNTPWDSGNFNPSSYLTTAAAASTYAPLASPALTGTPTAPTPALGTNSTQLATTAFDVASQPCANILQYGGNNTAGANNDTAWSNALASEAASSQKCIYLPRGYYNFASAISYTLPNTLSSITIKGDGPNVSNLYWASNGGISVTMPGGSGNNAHIRDLSLLAGAAGSGNSAITLLNATNNASPQPSELSDITNVSIHGNDGYVQTNYWSSAIYVASWSNINFVNVSAYGGGGGGDLSGYSAQGVGIYFTGSSGSSAPPQGTAYNVTGCLLNYLFAGIQYNNWVQGITVNQTNFTGGKYGIYVALPNQGQDQLAVIGSQFNASDAGIFDNAGIPALMLIGNYFLIPTPTTNNAGIQLSSEYEAVISGNTFQRIGASASGTNGLVVGSNLYAGTMITGNVFTGLGSGIFLESTSSGNNVQSNSYHANSTNITNSGTGNILGGGSQ